MFYVYWRYGSCNDGSCDYGLTCFKTREEADSFMDELFVARVSYDPICTLIEGDFVLDRED